MTAALCYVIPASVQTFRSQTSFWVSDFTMMFQNIAGSYATTPQLITSLAGILLVYAIYKIFTFIYDEVTSACRLSWAWTNLILSSVSNGYLLNSIIPYCKMIGLTNTDRRSNSKCCSKWVDYYQVMSKWLRNYILVPTGDPSSDHRSQGNRLHTFQ